MALGVGVWDNIQTRKHNRLSVVPHLVFILELQSSASDATGVETGGAGSEPEGAGTEAVPRGAEAGAPDAAASRVAPPLQTASLTLRNEGVGPAVIDSVRILVDRSDGRPACFASLNDAEEALAALDERVRIEATTHVSPGVVMAAGRGIPLMRFRLLEGDGAEEAADFLDREAVGFFDRWRMIVHYHSVYGEARTDTLDTFRRERTAG